MKSRRLKARRRLRKVMPVVHLCAGRLSYRVQWTPEYAHTATMPIAKNMPMSAMFANPGRTHAPMHMPIAEAS